MITMAIKYIVLPEQKKVIAMLKNTKFDCYNKAMKICKEVSDHCPHIYLCPDPNKMMMPNEFKGVAICHEDDVFDEETGKSIAKRICLDKYYRSFDKRLNTFKDELRAIGIRSINETNYVEDFE